MVKDGRHGFVCRPSFAFFYPETPHQQGPQGTSELNYKLYHKISMQKYIISSPASTFTMPSIFTCVII